MLFAAGSQVSITAQRAMVIQMAWPVFPPIAVFLYPNGVLIKMPGGRMRKPTLQQGDYQAARVKPLPPSYRIPVGQAGTAGTGGADN